ncbi:hypothetical protein EJ03DRAFT_100415 [Teratosphaeria nubilosa]|uniref:Uncharacterized protein n=1 Tax=Teratosphaeria nubilosa TaxID=161662 RepID=A0A6G1LKR5_9PEZI|nr:hypothetical protein EJ03DRAFT_100415 [Teratosphaeria nubilosa]
MLIPPITFSIDRRESVLRTTKPYMSIYILYVAPSRETRGYDRYLLNSLAVLYVGFIVLEYLIGNSFALCKTGSLSTPLNSSQLATLIT